MDGEGWPWGAMMFIGATALFPLVIRGLAELETRLEKREKREKRDDDVRPRRGIRLDGRW